MDAKNAKADLMSDPVARDRLGEQSNQETKHGNTAIKELGSA